MISLMCILLLLCATVLGQQANPAKQRARPSSSRAEPDDFEKPSDETIIGMWLDKFDKDKDMRLDASEAAAFISHGQTMKGESMTTDDELKSMVDNTMEMLDENGDGYGDLRELKAFVKKMHDMDGHLDRLPAGDSHSARSSRKKRKSRKKKSSSATREEL